MSYYNTKWLFSYVIFFFISAMLCSQNVTADEKKALIQKIEQSIKRNGKVKYNTVCCNSDATDVLLAVIEEREDWALERNLGYLYYSYLKEYHPDKENAKKWLVKQADYGTKTAQYTWAQENGFIKSSYFSKLGLPNNPDIHIKYLEKAYANGKNSSYLSKLIGAYREYEIYDMALKRLEEKVILSGDAFDIWKLSYYYREGRGTEKNISKANSLLKRSADLGYQPGQTIYGKYMFYGSNGVKQNRKTAIEYLQKAVLQKDCEAYLILIDNNITPKKSLDCKPYKNYTKSEYYYSKNRKLHVAYNFSNPKTKEIYQGDNTSLNAKIEAGNYILTNKTDRDYIKFITHQKGSKNTAITDLDYSKDFEIEMEAKFVKTPKSTVLSLLMGSEWRDEKLIVNFEVLLFSNLNYYSVLFSGEKEVTPYKEWTASKSSGFGPEFYTLTFRKIGDMSYYFINKELVFQKKFKPFAGDNFGVLIGGKTTIAIDSFSFYYY